jgi:hypothetical protein
MPMATKEEHLAHGDRHATNAQKMDAQHQKIADEAVKKMGGDPKLPTALQQDKFGPLISGVVSEKFDEKTKDKLRELAQGASASRSAAMAHYAAAGKRHGTGVARMHKHADPQKD